MVTLTLEKYSRNYSAHYIFDGKGGEFKFGVLEVDFPELISVTGSDRPKELRNMKFYNGILFPEFSCRISYLSNRTAGSNRHQIVHHQTEILQIIHHHFLKDEEDTLSWIKILQELKSQFPTISLPIWIETFASYRLEAGKLGDNQLWWIESFDFPSKSIKENSIIQKIPLRK